MAFPKTFTFMATVLCALAVLLALTLLCKDKRTKEGWASPSLETHAIDIVNVYERVLQRRPTPQELAASTKRLKEDPTFSMDILEKVLVLSKERTRVTSLQTNALKTELEGVSTRGQVILHVRNVYHDEIGGEPSKETEKFLLNRYVESGLDEAELIRLVRAVSIIPIAGTPLEI